VLAVNAVFSVSGYSQLSTSSYWAPISARSSTASAGCAHYMRPVRHRGARELRRVSHSGPISPSTVAPLRQPPRGYLL